jgi:hypothetical protein
MIAVICSSIHQLNISRLRLYELENPTKNKNNGKANLHINLKIIISGKK